MMANLAGSSNKVLDTINLAADSSLPVIEMPHGSTYLQSGGGDGDACLYGAG